MSSPEEVTLSRERVLITTALSVAPVAVGCAIGMLVGGRMKRRNRETVAAALFTLAATAAVPAAVEVARGIWNRPESQRVVGRIQRGIRHSDGIALDEAEEEIAGHFSDQDPASDQSGTTVHFPGH